MYKLLSTHHSLLTTPWISGTSGKLATITDGRFFSGGNKFLPNGVPMAIAELHVMYKEDSFYNHTKAILVGSAMAPAQGRTLATLTTAVYPVDLPIIDSLLLNTTLFLGYPDHRTVVLSDRMRLSFLTSPFTPTLEKGILLTERPFPSGCHCQIRRHSSLNLRSTPDSEQLP